MANTGTGVSWSKLNNAPLNGLRQQTTNTSNTSLYQWGLLQFTVWPLNVHEFDHETDTDWAQKEIAGSAIYREYVGENDENIYLRGKLFPYRLGGVPDIEKFEAARRAGLAQLLLRGGNPGTKLGWFVCEKLVRQNTFLSGEGLGQQIAFEAQMTRVPTPQYPETIYRDLVNTGAVAASAGFDAGATAAGLARARAEAAEAAAIAAAQAGADATAEVSVGDVEIQGQ